MNQKLDPKFGDLKLPYRKEARKAMRFLCRKPGRFIARGLWVISEDGNASQLISFWTMLYLRRNVWVTQCHDRWGHKVKEYEPSQEALGYF